MKKNELELTDENIKLTIEKDILNRNSQLVILSKILSTIDDNIVLSIDGDWGCGKTFFVKQLMYLISNYEKLNDKIFSLDNKATLKQIQENNLIVYYNAWENDSHNNPLESLIYNILDVYPEQKNQLTNFEEFKKLLKPFCRDILYTLSKGAFDINNFDKMNSFEDLANDIITIEEKKAAFNNLINGILQNNQRLILIIDELDRCNPDFAVKMLETIKHFYSNKKITIIISTNNLELSKTVKKFYGSDFNGYGYLEKFYDFVISLEIENLKKYLQCQLDFDKATYLYQDLSYLVMDHFNFSLRDCNKFVMMYNMLKKYIEVEDAFNQKGRYIFGSIIIPLAIALKIKDGKNYKLFVSNNGEQVIKDFLNSIKDEKNREWIIDICKTQDYANEIIELYHSMFNSKDVFNKFPFFETISFLGTKMVLEDE